MSFTDRIQQGLNNVFSGSREKTSDGKPTGYETMAVPYSNQNKKQEDLLDLMKGWSYACVDAIADEVASIDIKLFEVSQEQGIKKEIPQHDVLDALFRINDFTTRFDHFWLTQAYLEAVGEAPWFLDRQNGEVKNIFFLQPDRLTPIPGDDQIIEGYEYKLENNQTTKLNKNDVIFLKYTDPDNPFRGQGTIQAGLDTIQLDTYAEKWNKQFYKNSARPDAVFKIENDNLGDRQKKELKKDLRKQYQGIEKSHKLMVLFGDMDIQEFGRSQDDMDFLDQQQFSRDKILGIFRVPKAIIAQTEDVNFACHSEDTEVLTENGFKKYYEVKEQEKIATVNPETDEIEYHVPDDKHVYEHDGEMVHLQTQNTDTLITPDHRIWYRTPRKDEYSLEEVKDVDYTTIKTKAAVNYSSNKEIEQFEIPAVAKGTTANDNTRNESKTVDGDTFIEYLGYYLAEGGMLKKKSPNFRHLHTICQRKSEENINKIRDCIERTGFSYNEYLHTDSWNDGQYTWSVYGKNVNAWLRKNCGAGCDQKRIPKEFKNLSKRQLQILFDALMLGDGSWDKRDNRTNGCYATTSKQLADDVQEIALKLGYSAFIKENVDKRKNRKKLYTVLISEREEHHLRNHKESKQYNGVVWCFSVENERFITRRNGKISIHGNSAKTAERIFARYTIRPKMERLIQQLNEHFLPLFDGTENMFLDYVDPVPENQEEKLERYQSGLRNGWLTINEVREEEGLRKIKKGDVVFSPVNQEPFSGVEGEDTEVQPPESESGRARPSVEEVGEEENDFEYSSRYKEIRARSKDHFEHKEIDKEVEGAIKEVLREEMSKNEDTVAERWGEKKKNEFLREKVLLFDEVSSDVEKQVNKIFEKQKKAVISKLENQTGDDLSEYKQLADVDPDELELKEEDQIGVFDVALTGTMLDLYRRAFEKTNDFVNDDVDIDILNDPKANKFVQEQIEELATSVTRHTNKQVANLIEDGLSKQQSVDKIAERISNKFDEFSKKRADVIAKTETSRYNVEATQRLYEESDVVIGKQWVINPVTACEFCKKMQGQIVEVEESYFDVSQAENNFIEITGEEGGKLKLDYGDIKHPPLHPSCNCDLAPVTIQ